MHHGRVRGRVERKDSLVHSEQGGQDRRDSLQTLLIDVQTRDIDTTKWYESPGSAASSSYVYHRESLMDGWSVGKMHPGFHW